MLLHDLGFLKERQSIRETAADRRKRMVSTILVVHRARKGRMAFYSVNHYCSFVPSTGKEMKCFSRETRSGLHLSLY